MDKDDKQEATSEDKLQGNEEEIKQQNDVNNSEQSTKIEVAQSDENSPDEQSDNSNGVEQTDTNDEENSEKQNSEENNEEKTSEDSTIMHTEPESNTEETKPSEDESDISTTNDQETPISSEETVTDNTDEQSEPDESSPESSENETTNTEAKEVVVSTDDENTSESATQVSTNQETPVSSETSVPTPIPVTGGVKSRKKGLLIGAIFGLVVIVLASFAYVSLRPSKDSQIALQTVKKDIPVLNVATFLPLPHTYYPNIQNDSFQMDIQNQIFESLTKFENDTKLVPSLASSWTNPDSSTWVFKLLPNVKFHTGKTMTATDVKASLVNAETTDFGKNFTSTIKSVDVVDPLTVKVTTNGPDPLLANELANVYIYDTTSGKVNDPINGTGPYILKSDTKDAITLDAFDGYHGGHVYTREVKYLGYTDSSQISNSDLKDRKIQVMAVRSDPALLARLNGAGYTLTSEPLYDIGELIINTTGTTNKAMANVNVRKVIAQSLDVSKIIALADAGKDAPRATQTIPNGIPGYNPNIKAPVELSTTDAKKALADAGYPNGLSLKLTYFAPPPNNAIAGEIKRQLALVGITVNLDPLTDQQKLGEIALGGQTDMFYVINSSTIVDGSDILSIFVDSPNYSNKQFDALNDQASHELNPEKRVVLLQEMQKIIEDDQADIPLFQRESLVLASDPSIVIKRDTIGAVVGTSFWQTYAR